ncbi:MAG: Gx transporter family protein [Lachnospiraceae bacterium]
MMYRKTALLSVLLAFAMILSYIESLVPFYFGAPGIKLGLANLVVVLLLYLFGWKEALSINLLRIVLSGFLFGNLYAILYSLAGGILSFCVMLVIKKMPRFSIVSVSICGAVSHNIGQILVAMVVVQTAAIAYYIPVLLLAGLMTGFLIGTIALQVEKRIRKLQGTEI